MRQFKAGTEYHEFLRMHTNPPNAEYQVSQQLVFSCQFASIRGKSMNHFAQISKKAVRVPKPYRVLSGGS